MFSLFLGHFDGFSGPKDELWGSPPPHKSQIFFAEPLGSRLE